MAVCATGFASASMTPGRRDNTASATFFEDAHCTPDTSRTAVDLFSVIALHRFGCFSNPWRGIIGAYTPMGVSSKGSHLDPIRVELMPELV